MAQKHSQRFLTMVTDAKSRVHEVSVDEVKAKLDRGEKFLLLDVREESEYAETICPARFTWEKESSNGTSRIACPIWRRAMVLYCGGGFRSALAADNFQKMGYTKVFSMDGGHREWKEKGLPLTTGIVPRNVQINSRWAWPQPLLAVPDKGPLPIPLISISYATFFTLCSR